MKQVSNVTRSIIPGSSRYPLVPQRKSFAKHLFFVLFVGLALVIASCQKEALLDEFQKENLLTSSLKQNLPEPVPFNGHFTYSFGANGTSGAGTGTHTGRFTIVEQNNVEGFPVITGIATITASNGDQIFTTHTGLVQVLENGMAQVNSAFTITGGTGRFTGATGSFNSYGTSNLAVGTGSADFEGTISY